MTWLRWLFILPIRFYQMAISPWLGPRCRFHPTCSNYAIEAITRYGIVIGLLKSIARLLRCHPLFPGGYDPVENGWPRVGADRQPKSGA
ncbi:MAG: membrane protein insertion efficiency factor YidD [Myxococcales bacterium]|nr:MAG: membrane protein insertion efficiency factor YidD [Myxococcales bacterium]